jgi:RimJ/RimL family protein N-acetyltransferase/catechol 2,3-dioxygenase-like lactoylglutathione lyase family enzyme
MPWAADEPSEVDVVADRIARFSEEALAGGDQLFGIFDSDEREVLGGIGMHRRVGPGALEIGYWIRADAVGRGLATEAAAASTCVAFDVHGVERVEIRCDPANAPSAAVARRLGFRHATTLFGNMLSPTGAPRDTLVWVMFADEYRAARGRIAERAFGDGAASASGATPPVRGVLETALYVEDVDRSVAFYRRLLGADPFLHDAARLAAFAVSPGQVLLLFRAGSTGDPVRTPGGVIPPHGGAGILHLAFAIGRDDVDAWRRALGAMEIAIESEVEWPRGGVSLYFRDPDGHCVELATPGLWPNY